MRLTLRTMLAFLDDVLEGPDAKELEQKIGESKFASDLVHRIRGSIRRLRLGAPKVDGKGMGADANSVAEYLDNTMPSEHVPDFEKVCLESDIQLAEVAACHQVLTIVLGEPAAVDPATRDRMYRIGHPEATPAQPPVSHDGNGSAAGRSVSESEPPAATKPVRSEPATARVQPARSAKTRRTPAESAFPLKSLAITLLLGFVVAAVALRAIGPFDSTHLVWRMFFGPGTSQQVTQQSMPPTPRNTDTTPPAPETTPTGLSPARPSSESVAAETGGTDSPAATSAPGNSSNSLPAAAPSEVSNTAPPAASPAAATLKPPMPVADKADPLPAKSTVVPSASGIAPAPVTTPVAEPTPSVKPTEVATTPVNVGRYISEGQILARLDAEKNAWMVLPPDTPLSAEEKLLSLPTYRPQVFVAPTVKLTLAGETFLRLHAPDAASSPRVTIDFGRIILVPVGEMGNSVQVDFAGREGQLIFADVESVVAVEVRPYLPPGTNPLNVPSNIVVQMWATTGGAEWREPEQPSVRLNAGQRLQFIDESPVAVIDGDPLPNWIDGKNLSEIDRRASQELRKFLTSDRPLALSLLELTNYRQVEVRALSCRSLCYLDIFEPAIAALGDSQHKSYWYPQVAAIQSTLPFGSETVAKLQADLDKLHGEAADKMLRILQGYSPEQLAEGGAAQLVDALEDDSMAVRVLAYITLDQITGKNQSFRPEYRPEQEKSKVARWRKSLEEGQIVYKVPPAPLPQPAPPAPGDAPK